VEKHLGGRRVLGPIDLELPRGATTALVGPSGSGKSTLLRLLVGLIAPDRGTLRFSGKELSTADFATLRHRVGYVIQDGGLFPHLTAYDNLALLPRHLGWPPQRVRARVDELAALTRLPADGLHRYPAQLSGGQRQRVGLMRALMLEPEVLLLDEPLGALDPMVRADLQTDLKEVFTRLDKSAVLVTHDLGEAGYLASHVVLLRDGQVVQVGPLEELYAAPVDPFVTRFVRAQSYRLPLPPGGLA
jgi:osmoprotectant transport system ATP-binding protein